MTWAIHVAHRHGGACSVGRQKPPAPKERCPGRGCVPKIPHGEVSSRAVPVRLETGRRALRDEEKSVPTRLSTYRLDTFRRPVTPCLLAQHAILDEFGHEHETYQAERNKKDAQECLCSPSGPRFSV
jgi:hypothetical protein